MITVNLQYVGGIVNHPTLSNPNSLNMWEWAAEGWLEAQETKPMVLYYVPPLYLPQQVTVPPLASVFLSDSLTVKRLGDSKKESRGPTL